MDGLESWEEAVRLAMMMTLVSLVCLASVAAVEQGYGDGQGVENVERR